MMVPAFSHTATKRPPPAATRDAKKAWFRSEGFTDVSFVAKTSLPRDSRSLAPLLSAEPETPRVTRCGPDQDPAALMDSFLDAWLVEQDLGRALGCMDLASAASGFAEGLGADAVGEAPADLAAAQLRGWLVQDHGLVNELGHGDPGAQGFLAFRSDLPPELRISGTLGELVASRVPGEPYALHVLPEEDGFPGARYAALLQLAHTPRDALLVLLGTRPGGGGCGPAERWVVKRLVHFSL